MSEPETASAAAAVPAPKSAAAAAAPSLAAPPSAAMPAAASPAPVSSGAVPPLALAPSRPATAAVPIAILAFVLASVALVLGITLLHRSDELTQRLDQARAEAALRDQRGSERDTRLAALERQWLQAQGDADVSTLAPAAGGVAVGSAELRRHREQLALLDIERLVESVQLQLRLGAAPGVALEALTAADAHLSRLATPAALRVQAALRHDLTRLRAAPDVDRGALVARLEPLLDEVDHWHASADPLHVAARPAAPVEPPAEPTAAPTPPGAAPPGTLAAVAPAPGKPGPSNAIAAPPADGQTAVNLSGARLRAWLAREFGDFLRIRQVDTPDAILLDPAQQQLLRDRFRLGVLDLRQAILARDERAIRAEAGALDVLLQHYFDPNQPEVAAAQAQLRAAASAAVPAASVSLDETLAALHAARASNDG